MTKEIRPRGERGFTLMVFSLILILTVAFVGLAVDASSMYLIKARLHEAADAAALAAGRSVNLAETPDQAQTRAVATARQFFAANFPNGYLGSLNTPTVTPVFTDVTDGGGNPTGELNIAVSAQVNAPTYFMNVFNISRVPVAASSVATRRGLVMMLVLDQSSSMNTAPDPITGLTACQAMKQAAQNFITLFSPYDRIGLVTFDLTAHLVYAPSTSFGDGTLNTAIGNIVCQSNTNTISGLELAYQAIRGQGLTLAENTIVLFTDGSPNGVSAAFPLRTALDSRWSANPTLATPVPPVQVGSTYGQANLCTGAASHMCINMPVVCTTAGTVTGTMSQVSGQNAWGDNTYGLAKPTDSDPAPSFPATCQQTGGLPGNTIRQFIAYIPNNDIYGNSLRGRWDGWVYQVNNLCSPDPLVLPNCKNTGGSWGSFPAIGSGSNFFPAGTPYANANTYAGFLRPDQPNTIVAASMNGTVSEAFKIRADATYHTVIHSIYLTGNGGDAVDREFLPMVSNVATIPALPYDSASFVPYPNPAYQANQETGKYLVTANRGQLQSLFAQLASQVLRLSQ